MELKPDISVIIASRQTAIRPKAWIVLILLSVLLVAFGHIWFIQIDPSVPSGNPLQPTLDSRMYQAIYNGEYDQVILGQRYRVLVPLLARLLPGSFFDALVEVPILVWLTISTRWPARRSTVKS